MENVSIGMFIHHQSSIMIHSIDCIERFFRISFYFLCADYFKVCKRKYSKFQKISEKRILFQVTVNNTAVLVVLLGKIYIRNRLHSIFFLSVCQYIFGYQTSIDFSYQDFLKMQTKLILNVLCSFLLRYDRILRSISITRILVNRTKGKNMAILGSYQDLSCDLLIKFCP